MLIDKKTIDREWELWREFWAEEGKFMAAVFNSILGWTGEIKVLLSKLMYRQRGRFSQTFVNAGMAALAFLAVVLSNRVEALIAQSGSNSDQSNWMALNMETNMATTQISNSQKGDVTEYRVVEGDTVSSIALKYKVSIDTIMWENNLKSVDAIKPGQILNILPETGVRHIVKRGETIYSIAQNYSVDPQNIIDYPFNTFANDETFALAAGQELFIPDGIKPQEVIIDTQHYATRTVAPVPGVVGEGQFIWPTQGVISQKFSWYHQAVDIANPAGPDVVAAARGTVVTAGWNAGGYGNYVIIDHGNGYRTLYGHMVTGSLVVKAGDVVSQGQKIGRMGSTGRSTGTHTHFEIQTDHGNLDPLSMLK